MCAGVCYIYLLRIVKDLLFGDGTTLEHSLPLRGKARETRGRVEVDVDLVLHVVGRAHARVLTTLLQRLHPFINLCSAISLLLG